MKGEDETGPARKLLRSSTSSTVNSRRQAILPPVCIVCNHEKAYFTDAVSVLLHLAWFLITTAIDLSGNYVTTTLFSTQNHL
jgi:hypothetical protein